MPFGLCSGTRDRFIFIVIYDSMATGNSPVARKDMANLNPGWRDLWYHISLFAIAGPSLCWSSWNMAGSICIKLLKAAGSSTLCGLLSCDSTPICGLLSCDSSPICNKCGSCLCTPLYSWWRNRNALWTMRLLYSLTFFLQLPVHSEKLIFAARDGSKTSSSSFSAAPGLMQHSDWYLSMLRRLLASCNLMRGTILMKSWNKTYSHPSKIHAFIYFYLLSGIGEGHIKPYKSLAYSYHIHDNL